MMTKTIGIHSVVDPGIDGGGTRTPEGRSGGLAPRYRGLGTVPQ